MVRIPNKLATSEEIKEAKYVGIPQIRLRYLKDSKRKMGFGLWDVLEPKLAGYTYGPDSGTPTLSLDGLRQVGVL